MNPFHKFVLPLTMATLVFASQAQAANPDLLNQIDTQLTANHSEVTKTGTSRFVVTRSQHKINRKEISPNVTTVLKALDKAGYEAYLVGECVTDLLAGKTPASYDIATNALPDQVAKAVDNAKVPDDTSFITEVAFPEESLLIHTYLTKEGAKYFNNGIFQEYTQNAKTAQEDSNHRDVTINSLYYNYKTQEIVDFHGGLYDLKHHLIDTVAEPNQYFKEEPDHIIHVLQAAAATNATFTPRTEQAINAQRNRINLLTSEKIRAQLDKALTEGHAVESLKLMEKYQIMDTIFPQLSWSMKDATYHAYLVNALQDFDTSYAAGQKKSPELAYSVILYPAFSWSMSRHYNDLYHSTNLATVMVGTQAMDKDIRRHLQSIWTIEDALSNASKPEAMKATAEDPNFIKAYELLKYRGYNNTRLQALANTWKPYYDEKVAETAKAHANTAQ